MLFLVISLCTTSHVSQKRPYCYDVAPLFFFSLFSCFGPALSNSFFVLVGFKIIFLACLDTGIEEQFWYLVTIHSPLRIYMDFIRSCSTSLSTASVALQAHLHWTRISSIHSYSSYPSIYGHTPVPIHPDHPSATMHVPLDSHTRQARHHHVVLSRARFTLVRTLNYNLTHTIIAFRNWFCIADCFISSSLSVGVFLTAYLCCLCHHFYDVLLYAAFSPFCLLFVFSSLISSFQSYTYVQLYTF